MNDAEKWALFATALDEGRISVILEGASDSIDGGIIVINVDDVLDHIMGGNSHEPQT